jgi:hypothetical protein
MNIALSRRQIKDADRVGGIALVLPWLPGFTRPPLAADQEVDADDALAMTARAAIADSLEAARIVPVRVAVRGLRLSASDPTSPVLAFPIVIVIGHRWVHATSARAAPLAWTEPAISERRDGLDRAG